MKPAAKKIIFVFNSLNIGGIETKIVDLTKHYSQQSQLKCFLYLKNKQGRLLDSIPKNIPIFTPAVSPKLKPLLFPLWLSFQFRRQKPDLIISFGNYSSISSILGKILSASKSKLLISEDSSILEQINSETFPLLRKYLVKLTYPLADKIIVLTTAGKSKLLSLVPNLNSKIIIRKNWLPLSFPKTNLKNQKRLIDILFLGRFEPQKNPFKFLKIIQKLITINPHLNVVMIGYGSLQPQIEDYIQKFNLHQNVSLKTPDTDKISYLKNSKILLLTSDHEGFPLTILEALALNCLPVCQKLPEINNFFAKHSHYLLYQTPKKAVSQIQYLLKHPKTRQEISGFYQPLVFQNQKINFSNTVKTFDSLL